MSGCCTLEVSSGPSASVYSVVEEAGTVSSQDGTVTVLSESVSVIQEAPSVVSLGTEVVRSYTEDTVAYSTRVDFVDEEDVVYKGEAMPGSSEDDPLWRIRKLSFTGPEGDVSEQWAEGTSSFDKVWSDRLTYSYS